LKREQRNLDGFDGLIGNFRFRTALYGTEKNRKRIKYHRKAKRHFRWVCLILLVFFCVRSNCNEVSHILPCLNAIKEPGPNCQNRSRRCPLLFMGRKTHHTATISFSSFYFVIYCSPSQTNLVGLFKQRWCWRWHSRISSWGAGHRRSCSSGPDGGYGTRPESGGTWSPCPCGCAQGACGQRQPS